MAYVCLAAHATLLAGHSSPKSPVVLDWAVLVDPLCHDWLRPCTLVPLPLDSPARPSADGVVCHGPLSPNVPQARCSDRVEVVTRRGVCVTR